MCHVLIAMKLSVPITVVVLALWSPLCLLPKNFTHRHCAESSDSISDLELFEISMSDSRLHFVFMIHTEEKVKECIKHINYKIVESWKELVEFIGKIVHTNEELMMKDVKFNELKEALFPSEETSTST